MIDPCPYPAGVLQLTGGCRATLVLPRPCARRAPPRSHATHSVPIDHDMDSLIVLVECDPSMCWVDPPATLGTAAPQYDAKGPNWKPPQRLARLWCRQGRVPRTRRVLSTSPSDRDDHLAALTLLEPWRIHRSACSPCSSLERSFVTRGHLHRLRRERTRPVAAIQSKGPEANYDNESP